LIINSFFKKLIRRGIAAPPVTSAPPSLAPQGLSGPVRGIGGPAPGQMAPGQMPMRGKKKQKKKEQNKTKQNKTKQKNKERTKNEMINIIQILNNSL